MEAPDPEGEIPEGWTLEEWETYQILKGDLSETYASAAEQLGCSSSTVSRRIRRLRDRFGEDIYVSPRVGKLNVTREEALEGAHNGGAVISARWAASRSDAGDEMGTAARLANRVTVAALEALLEDPDRLALLDPRELLALGRYADLMAKRADILVDQTPEPSVPLEGGYGVDLSGLEAAASSGHHQEVFEAAEIVYRQFRVETGQGPIEVDEI